MGVCSRTACSTAYRQLLCKEVDKSCSQHCQALCEKDAKKTRGTARRQLLRGCAALAIGGAWRRGSPARALRCAAFQGAPERRRTRRGGRLVGGRGHRVCGAPAPVVRGVDGHLGWPVVPDHQRRRVRLGRLRQSWQQRAVHDARQLRSSSDGDVLLHRDVLRLHHDRRPALERLERPLERGDERQLAHVLAL